MAGKSMKRKSPKRKSMKKHEIGSTLETLALYLLVEAMIASPIALCAGATLCAVAFPSNKPFPRPMSPCVFLLQ
jgi:hypothetical protein